MVDRSEKTGLEEVFIFSPETGKHTLKVLGKPKKSLLGINLKGSVHLL